jgi:hypothetical protein
MSAPVRDTRAMIAGMDPRRQPGLWHFAALDDPARAAALAPHALAVMAEPEGPSLVLSDARARAAGLATDVPMAQITLHVHSALDGVGLTAAVAEVLTGAAIPCNVIAGARHDHIFVPEADADRAVRLLEARAAEERQR